MWSSKLRLCGFLERKAILNLGFSLIHSLSLNHFIPVQSERCWFGDLMHCIIVVLVTNRVFKSEISKHDYILRMGVEWKLTTTLQLPRASGEVEFSLSLHPSLKASLLLGLGARKRWNMSQRTSPKWIFIVYSEAPLVSNLLFLPDLSPPKSSLETVQKSGLLEGLKDTDF